MEELSGLHIFQTTTWIDSLKFIKSHEISPLTNHLYEFQRRQNKIIDPKLKIYLIAKFIVLKGEFGYYSNFDLHCY